MTLAIKKVIYETTILLDYQTITQSSETYLKARNKSQKKASVGLKPTDASTALNASNWLLVVFCYAYF